MFSKKQIKIGSLTIGGKNPILIQSMTNTKTSDIESTLKQINELYSADCDLVRIAISSKADAEAVKALKKASPLPLIGDIQGSLNLALIAIDNGIDKIRINPGNFKLDEIKVLTIKAKEKHIPIRIGVNTGSINPKFKDLDKVDACLASLDEMVKVFEKNNFFDLVLSIKASNVDDFIKANRKLKGLYSYPIHLGLTEAGVFEDALAKSSYSLCTLLKEGIGDTIRISITGDPVKEIEAAKAILNICKMNNQIDFVSCPTCARCTQDIEKIVYELKDALKDYKKNIKLAVMGCPINGLGEAKDAKIAIITNPKGFSLFIDGKKIKDIEKENVVKEIQDYLKEGLDF